MAPVTAQSSAEVPARIADVFAHAADFEAMPAWQPELKLVDVLERDRDGRATRVYAELDTPIRLAKVTLGLCYRAPTKISWAMTEGNVPGFEGSWTLVELGPALTRIAYEVVIDFGRLGRLVRGPAANLLREQAVSSMPGRLRDHITSRSRR